MRRFSSSRSRFEKNRPRGGDVEQGRRPRALERGEALPRRLQNLERAQNPLRIARAQPRRHQGIATGEFGVKVGDGNARAPRADRGAHLVRHGGNAGEPLRQRLEIESRAADEDGRAAVAPRLSQRRARGLQPQGNRIIDRRVDMAEQAVRRSRLLLDCGPRGKNAQIAIDLHRIGVDEDAAGRQREPQRQRGFAARGRSRDQDG